LTKHVQSENGGIPDCVVRAIGYPAVFARHIADLAHLRVRGVADEGLGGVVWV